MAYIDIAVGTSELIAQDSLWLLRNQLESLCSQDDAIRHFERRLRSDRSGEISAGLRSRSFGCAQDDWVRLIAG